MNERYKYVLKEMIKLAHDTPVDTEEYSEIVWAIQRMLPSNYMPILAELERSVTIPSEISDMTKWQELIDVGLIVLVCHKTCKTAMAAIPMATDILHT